MASEIAQIRIYPENGKINSGLNNRIFVLVTDPAGEPVQCELDIRIGVKSFDGKTSESGVYTFDYFPKERTEIAEVNARIDSETTITHKIPLNVSSVSFPFIIRSMKAEYEYGEELELELVVPNKMDASAHLDIYRGQTWVASRDLRIKDEQTQTRWLVQGVSGELTVEA